MNMMPAFARGRPMMTGARPLDDDELHRLAPSVFASEAHESRSDRYFYIPTIDVVNSLRGEGFEVFSAQQGGSRVPGKANFTKHILRMRKPDTALDVGGSVHEIVLLNSHDGTSSYRIMEGVFRMICTNGMIVGNIDHDIRVAHSGDARKQSDKVIEGFYTVLDRAEEVMGAVEDWGGRQMTPDQVTAFGRAARRIRHPELADMSVAEADARIRPDEVVRPNRREDASTDLWTVFNRAQERLIRGGYDVRTPVTDDEARASRQRRFYRNEIIGRHRRREARAVNGIDQNTQINRSLWTLAEAQAALLEAA